MSLKSSTPSTLFATALIEAVGSKYSYSRRPRDGLDAWQEHIRKSAASVDSTFSSRRDRELRRAVVPG